MAADERPRLRKPDAPPAKPDAPTAAPPPPKPTSAHPIDRFIGTRVVVQKVNGAIIEGDLVGRQESMLTLERVTLRGTKHVAQVEAIVLFFHRDEVAHLHGVPTRLEPITNQ